MDKTNTIEKIKNLKELIPLSGDFLLVFKNFLTYYSLINPLTGTILSSVINTVEWGLNKRSEEKLKDRLLLILQTIENIETKQKYNKINYEISLFSPELFRQILITEDREKAIDYLDVIECIYSSEFYNVDDLDDTIKILTSLSTNEYKLLKHIPDKETTLDNVLNIPGVKDLFEIDSVRLAACLESLNYKYLIRIFSQNTFSGGKDFRLLDIKDKNQTIVLTEYGKNFIVSMKDIKNKKQNTTPNNGS